MIWENGIKTRIISYKKRIASPGSMQDTLGAAALGWPRWMVWGGRWEEGSGWGTRVHPWQMHIDVWQNQYNIVKLKKKKKKNWGSSKVELRKIQRWGEKAVNLRNHTHQHSRYPNLHSSFTQWSSSWLHLSITWVGIRALWCLRSSLQKLV